MELLTRAPQQYVVAASCPWMGAWLCLMMQASHIPIDLNMLLEVKARTKVVLRLCEAVFKPMTSLLNEVNVKTEGRLMHIRNGSSFY